jgi:tetratricopeptide (TPR) repeat protein
MLLDWFDARDAAAVGVALADHFLPESSAAAAEKKKAAPAKDWRANVPRFRQRVAREAGPLKLNLFKRAKLLNSFKWRLLELGFDPQSVDELTDLLLMQLCVKGAAVEIPQTAGAANADTLRSVRRTPILLGEAEARFADGKYDEAVQLLEQALATDRRNADAQANLGAALYRLGRFGEAEQALRAAIEIKPKHPAALLNLGTLLRNKGQFAASETALQQAVKQDPTNTSAMVSLGMTLGMRARLDEAREYMDKALRLKPRDAAALCGLGWIAGIEGRFEEAEKHYRAALEADSRQAAAWAFLAGLKRMTVADKDWLTGAERALANVVGPVHEAKVRFSIGKYFDDLGNYPKAFEQYQRANGLQKLLAAPYDRTERTKLVDDVIVGYPRQYLAQRIQGASESERPVIVTGMMRSGTSLVEQIIASHPRASGAGELDFWSTTARRGREILQRELRAGTLTKKVAHSYLKALERSSGDAVRVVDKSTFNTDHLGLIHSVFPRARLVYVQRDPVDTCLSCYFQDFANVANFTMDLSDLAHYYREHHRLISHWRAVLPEGALLVVPYAELVADPETWSRRIVEFIGLEWDPRCLDFHQTQRSVLTASHWQVRQPMYSRSVGRWRSYEKHIRPLLGLRELADS